MSNSGAMYCIRMYCIQKRVLERCRGTENPRGRGLTGGWCETGLEVAIYCSLLAAMVFVPSVAQAQTDAERAALVAIYDATDGE